MSFAWPHLLWLLALPLALLAGDLFRRQRLAARPRPKILQAEAGPHHLQLKPAGDSLRARPRLFLILGLSLAITALARPQWGRIEEQVFDQSREIIIAVDLSRSMLATDIRPSRLERARLLIQSLLERLAGERVGLVVFSGTAFLQSPLSADYEILREFLPLLTPDYLPEGGTNYRALLETALTAFNASSSADRFLIVLSDGEATDDNWKPLLADLQRKNIRVLSLGLGTATGAMIPDGEGGFVKDERGAVVLSRLESATLRDLAAQTEGAYREAGTWLDLAALLRETVEAGRAGEFQETRTQRLQERFQWALAPALLCLLLSLWRDFPVRPTPRSLKLAPESRHAVKATTAALVLLLAALPPPANAETDAPDATNPPELSTLGRIVSRLASAAQPTARDWAELARETVFWGQKLLSAQQPVPANPVHDALMAVDQGVALDAQATDWNQLRQELEALLQSPESQQPEQPKDQDQSKQNQDQQNQEQNENDGEGQDSSKQDAPQKEQSSSPQDQNKPSSGQQDKNEAATPQNQDAQNNPHPSDSAFGDMNEDIPPPPPASGETQKVGGAPEPKDASPDQLDPALAMPLQKLDQLRNQDSPARLFQMMQGGQKTEPARSGKNW